jgi:hypothetical protein
MDGDKEGVGGGVMFLLPHGREKVSAKPTDEGGRLRMRLTFKLAPSPARERATSPPRGGEVKQQSI